MFRPVSPARSPGRGGGGLDYARPAVALETTRARLGPADADTLAAHGLVPGGVPPVSPRPGARASSTRPCRVVPLRR
ncbi:hypothetical protein [Streptomyces sp. NPDC088789]|uniref:hypothetical protein n=1 Tax=Streptomyces sp. NPDC088789 TaxID=3365899 RepID=UPI0037F66A31